MLKIEKRRKKRSRKVGYFLIANPDLRMIFQFCFDILKDNKIVFDINSGFYI